MNRAASILVADDQADVREALDLLLGGEGYAVTPVDSPASAIESMKTSSFDLVLFDMNYARDTTSGREGLALLADIRAIDEAVPLVAMTAWGSVDLAVAAIKQGAADFVEKPWENNRLLSIVRTQIERSTARGEAARVSRVAAIDREERTAEGFVADSAAMRRVIEIARQVAHSDAAILITGDNGVGKGLLAEQIHRWSLRADEVFVSVNMGAVPESLFEAEMFGHARGAFTDAHEARAGRFELADGGTLFLDEVGNLPAAQQAKLLRVLETGQFERVGERRTRSADVRVIAATNADLSSMVEQGEFRRDLYFRLNTIELDIPPLAERPEDIEPLARRFLERHCRRYRREAAFSPEAFEAMLSHAWPGNVRELNHAVERAVLLSPDGRIEAGHLMLAPGSAPRDAVDLVRPLEDIEREALSQALGRFDGDVIRAAESLGLSRSAMYRRMEKFGLSARA